MSQNRDCTVCWKRERSNAYVETYDLQGQHFVYKATCDPCYEQFYRTFRLLPYCDQCYSPLAFRASSDAYTLVCPHCGLRQAFGGTTYKSVSEVQQREIHRRLQKGH